MSLNSLKLSDAINMYSECKIVVCCLTQHFFTQNLLDSVSDRKNVRGEHKKLLVNMPQPGLCDKKLLLGVENRNHVCMKFLQVS